LSAASTAIVLALAADARYALPLAVTLRSALAHLEPERELVAYVVDDGLPPATREQIVSSTLDPRLSIRWLSLPRAAFEGLPCWGQMSATTYSRLLLADLLPPSVQRVLWLDCDLLVLGDLAELWISPLGGCCTGAVRDPFIPCLGSRLGLRRLDEPGLPAGAPYFNAGVMLIDLQRWRDAEVGPRALEFLRRYRDRVFYQDQAALNAILAGCWTELASRWNHAVSGTDAAEGREAGRQPAAGILHFSGSLKPWRFRGSSPLHQLYLHYVDQTAWAGWRPPSSVSGSLLALYEGSAIRRWLRPLEQRLFEVYMVSTRRYVNPNDES
jgi:lipopolysaccharide biosynthesis glycosyltransferase